jgi:hypothetical protein
MSGYVEAGYAVVGVGLAAYSTWILGRSRSISRAVGPVRDDAANDGAASDGPVHPRELGSEEQWR